LLAKNETKHEEEVILYTDGASRGNPGPAGIGVLVENPSGKKLAEISEYIGKDTNNFAEYRALLAGLNKAKDLGARSVRVKSDSELLVKQIHGHYRVKNKNLIIVFNKCRSLINNFDNFVIDHISRSENKKADILANNAIDTAKCNIE
jgi:ribonuclease HI